MIDAVYEPHSHLGMVISHQDNIKPFLIIRVQLKKPGIDMLQCLQVKNVEVNTQVECASFLSHCSFSDRIVLKESVKYLLVYLAELLSALLPSVTI